MALLPKFDCTHKDVGAYMVLKIIGSDPHVPDAIRHTFRIPPVKNCVVVHPEDIVVYSKDVQRSTLDLTELGYQIKSMDSDGTVDYTTIARPLHCYRSLKEARKAAQKLWAYWVDYRHVYDITFIIVTVVVPKGTDFVRLKDTEECWNVDRVNIDLPTVIRYFNLFCRVSDSKRAETCRTEDDTICKTTNHTE